MAWVELFTVFVVSHLVGDFLLQTDFQATNKFRGLGGDPVARRALVSHIATYTLAFIPAFIWIASERDLGWALLTAALISIPHLVQDDGRLVEAYARKVKKFPSGERGFLMVSVDQSFHVVQLLLIALLVGY